MASSARARSADFFAGHHRTLRADTETVLTIILRHSRSGSRTKIPRYAHYFYPLFCVFSNLPGSFGKIKFLAKAGVSVEIAGPRSMAFICGHYAWKRWGEMRV
jgi:hypothetical protein